jgi:hypothetical protein
MRSRALTRSIFRITIAATFVFAIQLVSLRAAEQNFSVRF